MHSLPVLHTLFIITWLGNVMKLRHMAVKPSNEHNQPEATRARAGNDSPQIPPPTGAPAIVVPMGFTNSTSHQALPTSLQARARSMTTCMCRACEAPGSAGSAWRMGSTAQPIAARLLYSAANGGPACQPSLAMLAVPRNTYNFHHSFTQARHDQPPIDTSMASSASARMHAMYTLVFTERRKGCRSAGCTASLGADREPAAPLARRLWRAPLTNHACSASHTRTSSSRAFARASLHHSVCCSAAALHLPPVQAVTASLCGGMWRTQRRLWLVGPGCSMPASPSCALCLQRALCPPQGVAAVKPRRHGTCLVRRQVRPPAISAVLLNTQLSVHLRDSLSASAQAAQAVPRVRASRQRQYPGDGGRNRAARRRRGRAGRGGAHLELARGCALRCGAVSRVGVPWQPGERPCARRAAGGCGRPARRGRRALSGLHQGPHNLRCSGSPCGRPRAAPVC